MGSSYQGTSLEVLFMGLFLGSSLLFASWGVGGPIPVDGTCQVTGNPYGFHGYRGVRLVVDCSLAVPSFGYVLVSWLVGGWTLFYLFLIFFVPFWWLAGLWPVGPPGSVPLHAYFPRS